MCTISNNPDYTYDYYFDENDVVGDGVPSGRDPFIGDSPYYINVPVSANARGETVDILQFGQLFFLTPLQDDGEYAPPQQQQQQQQQQQEQDYLYYDTDAATGGQVRKKQKK